MIAVIVWIRKSVHTKYSQSWLHISITSEAFLKF